MIIVLTIITILSCVYAIVCQYRQKTYEMAFAVLVEKVYKPKSQEDIDKILDIIMHESTRTKDTDND